MTEPTQSGDGTTSIHSLYQELQPQKNPDEPASQAPNTVNLNTFDPKKPYPRPQPHNHNHNNEKKMKRITLGNS